VVVRSEVVATNSLVVVSDASGVVVGVGPTSAGQTNQIPKIKPTTINPAIVHLITARTYGSRHLT
jgi:hypothetical protein